MTRRFLISVFLLIALRSYSQFGLYASAAYMNINGSSSFYNNTAPGLGQDIGSNTYQATDFGMFEQNSGTFKLVGGEIKTYKGTADNVCSGTLYYTVYPQGNRPLSPIYTNIDLGFYSDCFSPACGSFYGAFTMTAGGGCCSDRDQKWQNPGFGVAANIDLTTNPIGTYTLEMYYSYTGEDGGNGCGTTKYDNNNNNPVNYTASFTITPVMPVSFGTIRVQNNNSYNRIYWNTFSESNASNFNIQRSANGIDFTNIGQITAAGFSSSMKEYSFIDMYPQRGMNYYRIRMNETGGRFQNSVVVNTSNGNGNNPSLASNPAKANILLTGIEKGDNIILLNILGAEISRTISKENYINISTANTSNGTYFIKITNNKGINILPVVINH